MPFDTQEQSVQDGAPIYLYIFTIDGVQTRYTNARASETVNGFEYTAIKISHNRSRRTYSAKGSDELKVVVPRTNFIAARYNRVVPSKRVGLRITKVHLTDSTREERLVWQGSVRACSFKPNGDAELTCRSLISDLLSTIPRMTYQGPCNNFLYDSRCRVIAADFRSELVIDSISGDTMTLQGLNTASGGDATFFVGGYIAVDNSDFRTVVAQSGDVVTLQLPFDTTVVAGLTVEVFAGCDHFATTCTTKFNNGINYGGNAFVPEKNPFTTRVDRS